MLSHEPLHSALAHRMAGILELSIDSRRSIGAFGAGVNRSDQSQQMVVAQSLAARLGPMAAGLPVCITTGADHHRFAQLFRRIGVALPVNECVPHSDSLAKYAAAFFKISASILSRPTSARSRAISICSGVTFTTCP